MHNPQTTLSAHAASPPSRFRLPRMKEAGLLVVVVLLVALLGTFGGIHPTGRYGNNFLNLDNLFNGVATSTAIYAIMAVGMTVVIITGGIDISVGSIFGLAALATAYVLQFFPPQAPAWQVLPVALGVPLAVGGLCGLINGSLITGLRMHPFIVTLGTMSIFRGIAIVATPDPTLPKPPRQLPEAFTTHFMRWDFAMDLRLVPVLITLAAVLLGMVYLHMTLWGRQIYAVGGNEHAARFSGLNVGWIKLKVYTLMGLAAGLAAFVSVGRFQTASTTNGQGDELIVIAAAVVGGASLIGGRGTALGALLGALVIRLIDNGILILHLNQEYSKIIIGSSIILAVAVDRLSEYWRQRRLAALELV